MKKTQYIESALDLLDARNRVIADLTLGGRDALVALAIVLISAGYDHHKIVGLVQEIIGTDWAVAIDELLRIGDEKDNSRPWEQDGSDYHLVRIASPG